MFKIFTIAQSLAKVVMGVVLAVILSFLTAIYWHNSEIGLRNRIASQQQICDITSERYLSSDERHLIELKNEHDNMRTMFPYYLFVSNNEEISLQLRPPK